jgi:hypothetical protein
MQIMNASTLFCGLDIQRNRMSHAAIVDQTAKLIQSKRIPDSALHKFLGLYHSTKIVMEASTSTASIYRELTRYGCDIVVSHPLKTRLIAVSGRIKTDRVDCAPRNLYDSWM